MIHAIILHRLDDLTEFRTAARKLLAAGIPPGETIWTSTQAGTLFSDPLPDTEKTTNVPRAFVDLAETVICHRDEQRWPLLYQALWRLSRNERSLLNQPTDPLVHKLRRMAAAVKHDQHRMTAFLRFRQTSDPDGDVYVAWYEPRHFILRTTAAFFIDRFTNMRFSIMTPDLTLIWDQTTEHYLPGLTKADAPSEDEIENHWRRYYAAIFNPARINAKLMRGHMPRHFWHNLPEAGAIPGLIEKAGSRTSEMIRRPSADLKAAMTSRPR